MFSVTSLEPDPIFPSPSLKEMVRKVESVLRLFWTIVSLENEINAISGLGPKPGSVAHEIIIRAHKPKKMFLNLFNTTKFVFNLSK